MRHNASVRNYFLKMNQLILPPQIRRIGINQFCSHSASTISFRQIIHLSILQTMENQDKSSKGLMFPVLFVVGVIILLIVLKAFL